MGKIHLVTGGCRSGKSAYALSLAEELSENRIFIATCPAEDDEMAERVRQHQLRRENRGWKTVEEHIAIETAVQDSNGSSVVLVDCLSLWVSNLMEKSKNSPDESTISRRCKNLLRVSRTRMGDTIFVTNEVGMGVVPHTKLGRRFRDLLGRCNQVMADGADSVIFMVSGIDIQIKGNGR
jgi:adenosylcobinamide kinase/adenosylcobinamide-phosphate guanylyltransferase